MFSLDLDRILFRNMTLKLLFQADHFDVRMLLTLYYMAATWLQAWRLSSIRAKISEILPHGAGLVLYQEPDISAVAQQGGSTGMF